LDGPPVSDDLTLYRPAGVAIGTPLPLALLGTSTGTEVWYYLQGNATNAEVVVNPTSSTFNPNHIGDAGAGAGPVPNSLFSFTPAA
jgi:hypothetical protein